MQPFVHGQNSWQRGSKARAPYKNEKRLSYDVTQLMAAILQVIEPWLGLGLHLWYCTSMLWSIDCFRLEAYLFRYIKRGPRGHKQKKMNEVCFHVFCLCALGLVIKLNFNISKVAYWQKICTGQNKVLKYSLNSVMWPYRGLKFRARWGHVF